MAYTMYDPRLCQNNNQYKAKYPHLKEYSELDKLSPDWLVFCWWFACKASPLVVTPMGHLKRIELALHKSTLIRKSEETEIQSALNGQFPDDVKQAIDVFASFDVDLHIEAYKMAVDMFEGMKESCKKENYTTGEGDTSIFDRDSYMKSVSSVSKMMPDVVKQIENTYGVKEIDESMMSLGADQIAEMFFTNKRNN